MIAGVALVFDLKRVVVDAAPGLAELDGMGIDRNVAGETGDALAHVEADQDAEGGGVGEDEEPHAGGGVVDEERAAGEGVAVGGGGEGDRPGVPEPRAGEPGEGLDQRGGGAGSVGGNPVREFAVLGLQMISLIWTVGEAFVKLGRSSRIFVPLDIMMEMNSSTVSKRRWPMARNGGSEPGKGPESPLLTSKDLRAGPKTSCKSARWVEV